MMAALRAPDPSRHPRAQVCGYFVGDPFLQDGRVVLVVGEAKLRNSAQPSLPVPLRPHGSRPPFFCIMRNQATCSFIGQSLGADQPVYALQAQGLDGTRPPHTSIEAMASHYDLFNVRGRAGLAPRSSVSMSRQFTGTVPESSFSQPARWGLVLRRHNTQHLLLGSNAAPEFSLRLALQSPLLTV